MDDEKKLSEVVLDAEKAEDEAAAAREAAKQKKKKFTLKHPRRFMVWMDLLGVALLVMGLYLGIRYFMNQKSISAYESGNYEAAQEEQLSLTNLNLVESYLPYYNLGNVAYKNEDYTRAIAYYKQALSQDPPKYKECPIRINMALALIKQIDFNDLGTKKKLDKAIQTLRTARTILTAHECAGAVEDDGHSPEAEQLKHDIDEWLDKLENQQDQQDDNQDDGNDGDQDQQNQDQDQDQDDQNDQNDQDKETEQEKKIREQLEQQQRDALEQRAKEQQQYNEQNYGGGNENGGGADDFAGKYW